MEGLSGGVAPVAAGAGAAVAPIVRRAAAKRARAVMVVGPTARQSRWLPMVLGARDEGAALGPWMRERGHTQPEIDAAYALQARMKAKGRELEAENVRPLLLGVRAEIVDRVKRRVGMGTGRFAADVDTLRAIDAALRQAAVWERQDAAGGVGAAPAAPGASARGARNGAVGAVGGGKAVSEGSVAAINGGETGGSEGECAVEASGEALGGGIGGGEGDGGGVLLSVPLAGC